MTPRKPRKPGPRRKPVTPRIRATDAKFDALWSAQPVAWFEVWWACGKHTQHRTREEAGDCMAVTGARRGKRR